MRENKIPIVHYAGKINHLSKEPFFKRMHNHPDSVELLLINEGEGVYNIDGVNRKVSPHSIVIYNKGVWHEERTINTSNTKMQYVALSNIKINNLPDDHIIKKGINPVIKINNFLVFKNYFEEIVYEKRIKDIGSEIIANSLANILVEKLLRILYNQNTKVKESNSYKLTQEMKHYIQENHHQNITLKKLSDTFFLSPYYLSHLFKSVTNISPIQYLIAYRLDVSKHLLITTNLPISKIALNVGYDNIPHFQNTFKKKFNISPGKFREQYKY